MGIDADKVPGVIAAYRQAALADGRADVPGDLWTEICGVSQLRNFGVCLANQVAAAGGSARLATYMHPILPPARGVPHCAEPPFLFVLCGEWQQRVRGRQAVVRLRQGPL